MRYQTQHEVARAYGVSQGWISRLVARPKTARSASRELDHHHRVRRDLIGSEGKVTLRHEGRLYHIGVRRTHARTPVILLVQDLDIRVVHAVTGELLRAITVDPLR